jgi:hypothetical protein
MVRHMSWNIAMQSRNDLHLACFAVFALAFLVSSCSSGTRQEATAAAGTADPPAGDPPPVKVAIQVGRVDGGDTNLLWKPEVSDENFRTALEASLAAHAMAEPSADYLLDAELVELHQPVAGFDVEVTATIHYTLVCSAGGAIRLDEMVTTPFTTTMNDSFILGERLRLADEGAIKANIDEILAKIAAAAQPKHALASSCPSGWVPPRLSRLLDRL